jgi:hypothetical protein
MMALREAIEEVDKAVKHADEVAKKLTTKDRKKLKSTTFCGPDRSFPVPDCQHVATAKAYLKRSKFSTATKKRIAACINRKSKELGCKPGKPAKAKVILEYSFDNLPKELRKLADSKIFKTTKELVDASIENEGMELDFGCEDCE